MPTTPKKTPKKTITKAKTAAKKPAARKRTSSDPIRKLALAAAQFAIEKKATNAKLIDVRSVTPITDYFVVVSGSSDTQVKAIADHVISEMRKHGAAPWKSEGWEARQWIIIDFVDLVVHIFHESAREYYNLERLWADVPTEILTDTTIKKPRSPRKKE